jgi:outer membrane immunogenic protein
VSFLQPSRPFIVIYSIKEDFKMKKPIITTFAFGALIIPAMAADLRYYKAPPPAPVMNWTGFYIGANGGHGVDGGGRCGVDVCARVERKG